MKYQELGRTGLKVSQVGFGGIPIIPLEMEESVAVVRHAFDRGITFFDTANLYFDSEKKIGRALEGIRDQVILATKTQERQADKAAEHIALSLENLRTDRIDLYQFHQVGNQAELEKILAPGGAMEAVREARSKGKIRYFGITSHELTTAIKACRTGLFDTVQFPFNFVEREPEDALFGAAEAANMGIIGMKPFGGGLLDRADLCIKYLQEYPNVVPIPGFCRLEEIDQVVELYRDPTPLAQNDRDEIDRIREVLGTRFCHRCGYCSPCEHGVTIVPVMLYRSFAGRFSPAKAVAFVKEAMETVENCIECGECAEKCPYNLPIPEVLKDNYAFYRTVVGQM